MAVPVDEYPRKGKSLAQTRMKPVVLSFVTDDDIAHIAHGFDSKTLRKKRPTNSKQELLCLQN